MPGFWAASAPATSSVMRTPTWAWISKLCQPLSRPAARARAKPSSSHGRYSAIRPGTKCIGSQPSHSSAVSRTVASLPEPIQIGSCGSPWMIERSGLPSPVRTGAR